MDQKDERRGQDAPLGAQLCLDLARGTVQLRVRRPKKSLVLLSPVDIATWLSSRVQSEVETWEQKMLNLSFP